MNLTKKRVLSVNLAAKMATARVMSAATTTTASCLLLKRPFFSLNKKAPYFNNNLRFNTTTKRVSKRLFSCKSIYNPDVQIKEEGQPETLDYRVYFLDNSGKKVISFTSLKFLFFMISVLVSDNTRGMNVICQTQKKNL